VRVSKDGSAIYVAVTGSNRAAVIDAGTFEIERFDNLGRTPFWIAVPGNP